MPVSSNIIIRSPLRKELHEYYSLRWKILREPWGQAKGSEKDEHENAAAHRIAVLNKKIIAVGRLHSINKESMQIRYMAVSASYENQGVGKALLFSLEDAAEENMIKNIMLHARKSAVGFYQKYNYKIIAESHVLYGKIKHMKMIKEL